MKRRAHGVVESVQNLLGSSLKNQLRPGDTLGVWTYNERLYAGQFPLEQWTPETQPKVAVRLLGFLQDLTYEKKASFDKVVPELERVIRESEYITVILLSSGEEKMKGTPFDDRINAAYKQWQQESQKATGPLVTVLRAKAGKFTDWLVTPASWPPELPPLAPE
ncbi:MAG TPA: hypothetical protein VN578_04085, partial [Candidatus Binatia bacterium]|nr:hypothetical protein [Candidatus Binatia bacterium]